MAGKSSSLIIGLFLGLGIGISEAGTIAPAYTAFVCGLDGSCPDHIGSRQQPTPAQAAQFSSALFTAFYEGQGYLPGDLLAPFSWFFTDVNSQGTIIGSDWGGANLHGQFIYMQGSGLVCCTTDEPFFLSDINDSGVVVGTTDGTYPFMALAGPKADHHNIDLNILPHPRLGTWQATASLTEIADNGRILAEGVTFSNSPGFVTVLLSPVPEPGSRNIVISSLLLFAGVRLTRRWKRIRTG